MEEATGTQLARLSALTTLMHQGRVAQLQVDAAQGSASEAQDRVQSVLSAVADDQRRLTEAKLAAAKFTADTQAELNQQLTDRRREINELTPLVMSSADVVKLLTPQDTSAKGNAAHYTIVREGQVITAELTTSLQPGDVMQVEAELSEPPQFVAPGTDAPEFRQSSR